MDGAQPIGPGPGPGPENRYLGSDQDWKNLEIYDRIEQKIHKSDQTRYRILADRTGRSVYSCFRWYFRWYSQSDVVLFLSLENLILETSIRTWVKSNVSDRIPSIVINQIFKIKKIFFVISGLGLTSFDPKRLKMSPTVHWLTSVFDMKLDQTG